MITLDVQHLSKHFPGNMQPAVQAVSFALENGEILALVGPSGCGKTTTLRLIAGLERPDAGQITLNGHVVAGPGVFVPPEQRGVGMVFQDYALFPHLNVAQNVAFGLRGQPEAAKKEQVRAMLALVGLEHLGQRYPHALSGGERQRVALARALAPRPVLVLMDEPFSSLDADRRAEVREQVRGILKQMQATTVFVTHDQEEALYMGDRLAVFQRGQLQQIGTPEQVFHTSTTRFVAEFMGDSDFLPGETVSGGIQTPLGWLPQSLDAPAATPVEVAVRMDDLEFALAGEHPAAGNGTVAARFFRGAFNVYRVRLDAGGTLHILKPHTEHYPAGQRVQVSLNPGHELAVFVREGRGRTGDG